MIQITLAIVLGFITGLAIALISLIVLVILGAKAIRSGKYFNDPQGNDTEIT